MTNAIASTRRSKAIANGAAPKRTKVSGSPTNLYDVKGYMVVHQCVEVKTNRQDRQTYPRDGGTGFGKGRTRDTV